MKETLAMNGEDMLSVETRLLLTIGEGSIDPATRVATGEITDSEINEFVDALNYDEYHEEIDAWAIPSNCVDGRYRKPGASAAGGTFSLVVGDALTTNSQRRTGENAATHAKRYYGELLKLGQRPGGHSDEHAEGANCGCGAEDKLDSYDPTQPSILAYIGRRPDDLRAVIQSLGVDVSDELHAKIVSNAELLHSEGYATNGAELRDAFVETAGPESVEILEGTHKEVVLYVNNRAGRTLNKDKLRDRFGDKLQAFNLDVVNLQKATELLALSREEASEQFIGALYFNVAAAAVLAGPSLRVVVG